MLSDEGLTRSIYSEPSTIAARLLTNAEIELQVLQREHTSYSYGGRLTFILRTSMQMLLKGIFWKSLRRQKHLCKSIM